jgi:ribonuclease VapC
MILETLALPAVMLNEPEAGLFAASYVEAAIYVDRNGDEVRRAMPDTFLAELSIRIEPVTPEQALLARQAFVLFGKGRHRGE